MTPTHRHENKSLIRYSPRPRAFYKGGNSSTEWGPATSAMLKTQGAWNLAYLSHDFEASLIHPDPDFTVLVRRTTQMRLDGAGLDLAMDPVSSVIESLFRTPAPRAVHVLRNRMDLTSTLPLYQAYGAQWLHTITQRSYLCQAEDGPPDNIVDLSLAHRALSKYCK
jgi:hypothetical protein